MLDQPFSIQVQADDADDVYLWTANIPEYRLSTAEIPESDTRLVDPVLIDFGIIEEEAELSNVRLYYVGLDTFYLVILADAPYTLSYVPLAYTTPAESETQTITLSPQSPVQLLRITEDAMPQVMIAAEIIEGTGLSIQAKENGAGPAAMQSVVLGETGRTDTIFPLNGMVSVPVTLDGEITVVVNIPTTFTQGPVIVDPVTLDISWTGSASSE